LNGGKVTYLKSKKPLFFAQYVELNSLLIAPTSALPVHLPPSITKLFSQRERNNSSALIA